MKIRLIGQANHTGIGTHFAGFVRALRQVRPDLQVEIVDGFDNAACVRAVIDSRPTDINICFLGTDMRRLQGRNIQWIPFESTRVPDILIQPLLDCHEIWTMTQWSQQVLINNGIPPAKIAVVPQGIDTSIWQSSRTMPQAQTQFLLVGKYEQRKGINETIDAWAQSLGNQPDTCLTIKTQATMFDNDDGYNEITARINDHGIQNYRLIWGQLEDHDMVQLYQQSHVFVLPTRGEGWGRPLMEAAAMGLPVITTRCTAHGEWLQPFDDSVLWIDYDMVPVDDEHFRQAYGDQNHWGYWAQPRIDSLAMALQTMQENLSEYRERARATAQAVRQQYCWTNVARRALDRLQLL